MNKNLDGTEVHALAVILENLLCEAVEKQVDFSGSADVIDNAVIDMAGNTNPQEIQKAKSILNALIKMLECRLDKKK